jgi:gliding motility-associated-like protein
MKRKAGLFLFCLFTLNLSVAFAQKQNNQWRFGQRGGIDFNGASPVFVSGAAIQTAEGSASVADKTTGALLFYTDGVTVWNAQNQTMPNGTGLLGGAPVLLSSTTAAVIIPRPGVSNEYYLVTIDEQGSNNGIRYSVVDMNLDGGRGDIIPGFKNISIYQTTSEKLEVVPASDQQSFWLLSHDLPGNSFLAFRVTSSGFQTTPEISTVGGVQGNGSGHLKINHQFNKLAMGNLFDRTIELFDFNNTTGVVSNPVILGFNAANPGIYGVEFSPSGQFLYISNLEFVTQYDISLSSPTAIENSRYVVTPSGFSQPATLQRGPDQKIYINAGSLDVINCPDNAGIDCGFQSAAIPNQAGGGGYGLPKWVYSISDTAQPTGNNIISMDSCRETPISFSIGGVQSFTTISWNFGDVASGANNTSTLLSPTHLFTAAGNYQVSAILFSSCRTDTLFFSIRVVDCAVPCTGTINTIADTCLQTVYPFSVSSVSSINAIAWNFGDPNSGAGNTSAQLNPAHQFTAPGVYTVRAIITFGCGVDTLIKTVRIVSCLNPASLSIRSAPDTCIQSNIQFRVLSNRVIESIIEWQFGAPNSGSNNTSTLATPVHVFTAPGTYTIRCILQINCSAPPDPNNPITTPCFYIDTVFKTIQIVDCDSSQPAVCAVFVPNAFTPNGDGINDQFRPKANCPLQRYELQVFNRWGERMFLSTNPSIHWDGTYKGKACSPGSYVYFIRYQFATQSAQTQKGTITLLQ